MQLKVDKNIKLEDVESYYKKLYDYMDKNLSIDLLLPNELENNYLGLVPSLYQLAVTWVRYFNSGKLLLDIDDPSQTDFDKLYENELLFPLISFVWNKNEVYNKDGEINLRNYLRPKNVELFDKMRKVKSLKGNKLLLTSFDHLPEDRGLLPCFEINHEFIKNESILFNNLKSSISDILNYSSEYKNVFDTARKEIIGIIYELIKNTYEWAKTNENNVPVDPSIRGLIVKFFKKRRNTFLKDFEKHSGLSDYFKSDLFIENNNGEIAFIEVSVFDSGVGFINKFKSFQKDNNSSDIDILRMCLIKHNTSAKGLGKDDKGIGLDRILAILDKKGFLRIKTGNLNVYRNLITHNYKLVDNDNIRGLELFDWTKKDNTNYTVEKKASGSLITIIFPLSTPFQNKLNFNE